MSEEKQPQWLTELKTWGIDVEVFYARWEETGADAKAKFEQALMDAKAAYEGEQTELKAAVDEARQEAEAFVQKMGTAWDAMISSIQQQMKADAQSNDTPDTSA